ncbi:NADH:flavin oxidoreductase [Gynuella sp.]|uniref:NADH:flavin oxidoreductase n=1 Tax=Gynuella sp. TaxID=2969146 RepID=UPI003D0FAD39
MSTHYDSASVNKLFEPLMFTRGPMLKNRFSLAPLTNTQSHEDGTASEQDRAFLAKRATGGFALVTSCAAHVDTNGIRFTGQLGCFDDRHIPGLSDIAQDIRNSGALSSLQLHHAGNRALDTVTDKVGPSLDTESNTRSMNEDEIQGLIEQFAAAALRAEKAGFDGVQIHAGHGYLIAQFMSPILNKRQDKWGESFENRMRLLFLIIEKIRMTCDKDFQIGVRISPERFGLELSEMILLVQLLEQDQKIDYIDLSLWDVNKEPEQPQYKGEKLISYFTSIKREYLKIGVAGSIMTARTAAQCLEQGADFVSIGRAGILAHDFPLKLKTNSDYVSPSLPVSKAYLQGQSIGPNFIKYLSGFTGFVEQD